MTARKSTKVKDITGNRYGKLVAIRFDHCDEKGNALWLCKCDCGKSHVVLGASIRRGNTKSCGCFHDELPITHGLSKTKIYKVWQGLKTRCNKKQNRAYKNYGGRGISYDPRWEKFDAFLSDMGEPPDGLTLDRIDNNGDYCKDNCRWATWEQQQRNRRSNRIINYNGREWRLVELATYAGMIPATLAARINHGWDIQKAIEKPVTVYNYEQ